MNESEVFLTTLGVELIQKCHKKSNASRFAQSSVRIMQRQNMELKEEQQERK